MHSLGLLARGDAGIVLLLAAEPAFAKLDRRRAFGDRLQVEVLHSAVCVVELEFGGLQRVVRRVLPIAAVRAPDGEAEELAVEGARGIGARGCHAHVERSSRRDAGLAGVGLLAKQRHVATGHRERAVARDGCAHNAARARKPRTVRELYRAFARYVGRGSRAAVHAQRRAGLDRHVSSKRTARRHERTALHEARLRRREARHYVDVRPRCSAVVAALQAPRRRVACRRIVRGEPRIAGDGPRRGIVDAQPHALVVRGRAVGMRAEVQPLREDVSID